MAVTKKFSFGISLKLFFAFWVVILSTILISNLIIVQFKGSATQSPADEKQLALLTQLTQEISSKKSINLSALQERFYNEKKQHLIIKNKASNQVYLPTGRPWFLVGFYLKNNEIINPVTINFKFTQVTGASEVEFNGGQFQLFISPLVDETQFVGLLASLPFLLRITIISVVSFIICWLLARTFSRPLLAIEKASKSIGNGNLNTRVLEVEHRSDELGTLARSFNKMAAQLQSNETSQQRLLCDVSHELRSPLTRLQISLDLLEKNIDANDAQKQQLLRCETEIDLLDEMISDVLRLSRLENNLSCQNYYNIELLNLVQDIVDNCQYIADKKHIAIEFSSTHKCVVLADKKLLDSAINNVLMNAVKYSPKKGTIKVVLNVSARFILLSVTDQGSGVPEEMLKQLFTPFFRVSDTNNHAITGTGLGLAIAQQAIWKHQGEIHASNSDTGGLSVSIKLPIKSIN